MSISVNIIGAGRVGQTLMRLIARTPGIDLNQVSSRRASSATQAVAVAESGQAVDKLKEMTPADIWFLTVPDTRIAEVATALAQTGAPPATAVHCSGFHSADIMASLSEAGWSIASAHPMLSFADPSVAATRFEGTYTALEGDIAATDMISDVFQRFGAQPFPISSEAKVLYHAAAVITNNFTTVLQGLALEAWHEAGVPPDIARDLNATLLKSTLENIDHLGPADALTGPAARGDKSVVEIQGAAVRDWDHEAGEIYEILSRMAERLKSKGKTRLLQDPPRQ